MTKPQGISLKALTDLSRRNPPRRFLKTILDGLIYDGFRFPTFGSDGCIGSFCISKALPVTIRKRVLLFICCLLLSYLIQLSAL